MTELHIERLQQAILAQNQSFLSIKELNQDFYVNVLKIPVRKEKEKEHLEKAKPLLAEIQELIDAKKKRHGGTQEINYYDFPETLEQSDFISPPTALDGYIAEATRKYFVHTLHIRRQKSNFEYFEDQYFDFRLDDMLEDKTLRDSLEIRHTIDWALIGKILAAKEVAKLTRRRGPQNKRAHAEKVSLIDRKRLHFIEGVESEHIHIEMELNLENMTILSDHEVVSTYQDMLLNSRLIKNDSMDELERHVRLGNMSVEAACNSISRARNSD